MGKLRLRRHSPSGTPISISHDCQGQECCIYDDSEPAVLTAASYNGYPAPVVLNNHPLSSPQSSELQQHIPTSSHFPNNDDEFFPAKYQDVPETPHHPVISFETYWPAGAPITLGVARGKARGSTFHKRELDSLNAVTTSNEPNVDSVSNLGEDRCPPTGWMYGRPNTTQSLDTDRYSSSSHMALMPYYDSQITSDVSYMSHNAQSPSPQLHSSQNHLPTSPRSPENPFDFLAWDSSHLGQEAASVELSPVIWISIEGSPVPPALPQSGSINAAVAGKENRCPLCGIRFTQSQVLNRHMKDKHEDKGSCAHCSSFKWSRGRPYLYRRHLQVKHSGLSSSEAPPRGTRKALRARQCKVRNKTTQVTSRGLVPNQCCLAIDATIFQNHLFLLRAICAQPRFYPPNYSCRGTAVVCMVYTCPYVHHDHGRWPQPRRS